MSEYVHTPPKHGLHYPIHPGTVKDADEAGLIVDEDLDMVLPRPLTEGEYAEAEARIRAEMCQRLRDETAAMSPAERQARADRVNSWLMESSVPPPKGHGRQR